jgi:hypothetical protein
MILVLFELTLVGKCACHPDFNRGINELSTTATQI